MLGVGLVAASATWSGMPAAATPDAASPAAEPASNRDAASEQLPDSMDYDEGDPIPDGYRVVSSPRYDIAFSGLGTLLAGYTFAALSAVALPGMNKSVGGGGKMAEEEHVWPLYVPVVGPIIACGTAEGSQFAAVVPSMISQMLGFTLFVVGLATEGEDLVRNEPTRSSLRVAPLVGSDRVGLGVSGTL